MTYSYTVVGRDGHMDGEKFVCDSVTVTIEEDDLTGIGHGATEKEAVKAAQDAVAAHRKEMDEQEAARERMRQEIIEEAKAQLRAEG